MVKVIFLSNPFDTDKKTILEAPYIACKTIKGYCKVFIDDYPDTEFNISVNGHVIEKHEITKLCPAIGDNIVVIPVIGKGVLRSIANIALMAFVNTISLGASWFINGLAKAAAMYIGGRIINAILPLPKQNSNNSTVSPTYGWNGAKPVEATETPIGKTFGTVMPAPVVLARHVTTDGDKQYLNILYGAGEGPIDSIENITIDGNPVSNYKDVQVDIRLGTNDQEPISNFGDTFADQVLSYKLTEGEWYTHQTEGNAGEGLEIMIDFPGGLFHTNDDGGLGEAAVVIEAYFRLVGSETWIGWGTWSITGSKNTAIRRSFRLDNTQAGKYEVKVGCTGTTSGGSNRYIDARYWSQLSQIVYDDFARPGKVLVGIKALATDQLSGSDPNVSWTQTRANANVWNPNTLIYEKKPLTNPYWACYDEIHNCKYLKNINTGQYEYVVEGNPITRIDYPAFAENAAYSAELDSAGDPRFELNLYLDTNISFWDALARLAVVGRGVIIPKGTKYSCICDKPAIPTQMFTMGNITEKSLKGKFQSTKDRAQSIEVEFFNKQKDYKQDLAVYYGDDWDSTARVPNPTKVTRYGITKYKYAYRDAVFMYKGNKYLKRTENWEADIDAIACKPGDVVLLQHDVPKWGLAGGRIISATANTVIIDKEVVLESGKTYSIEIRLLNDSRVNRVVQSADGNLLTLTTPFTDIPNKYDIYAFGESNKVTKPFKIINIVRSKDLKCKLTGVEYIEDMYSDVVDIPVINYSPVNLPPVNVEKLQVEQVTWRTVDGTTFSQINISWTLPRGKSADKFSILVSKDKQSWSMVKTTQNYSESISVDTGESYYVKIITEKNLIQSSGVISNKITTGRDSLPPDPINLMIEQLPSGKKRFIWDYAYPNPNDVAGFRIKYNAGSSRFWGTALPLYDGLIQASPFETSGLPKGTCTVMVKAVDYAGNESANMVYAIDGIGDELVENVLEEFDFKELNWAGIKTGCHINGGILRADDPGSNMWNINSNMQMWNSDDYYFYAATFNPISYFDTFNLIQSGQLNLQFVAIGNTQVYYRAAYPSPMWSTDTESAFISNDLNMWHPGQWAKYTGKIQVEAGDYDIRIDVAGGAIEPTIQELKAIVDVQDIDETINDVTISATGLRIPLQKKYHRIKNVNCTLQDTGTNAFTVKVADKSINGPLVNVYSATGVQVAGVLDITIQGY